MLRRDWLRGLLALGFASVFGERVLARRSQDKPEFFVDPHAPEPRSLGTGIVTELEDHGIRGESLEITYFDEEMDQEAWQSEELYDDAPLVRPQVEVYQEFTSVPEPPPSINTYRKQLTTSGHGSVTFVKDNEELRLMFDSMELNFEYQQEYTLQYDRQCYRIAGNHVPGTLHLRTAVCDATLAERLKGLFADYRDLPTAVLRLGELGEIELTKPILTSYGWRVDTMGEPVIFTDMTFHFIRANPTTGCSNA